MIRTIAHRGATQHWAEHTRSAYAQALDGGAGPSVEFVRQQPDLIQSWVRAGRTVRVWTVNDLADANRCLALGASELTTDHPELLIAALRTNAITTTPEQADQRPDPS